MDALPKGTVLGRYVVLAPLGHGGFGAVYTAYDPKLDRRVAIKILQDGRSDTQTGARLLREAQAMASLSHPNVVNVHDVGTAHDRVYIAMERVDGATLDVWLNQVERTWREILVVMVGAARGLAAAHAAGIIHRDFKPLNVLIDAGGRARVLDFGLARRIGGPSEDDATGADDDHVSSGFLDQQVTVDGVVLGTPAYMAPEQFLERDADALSDQFAFCVTLYLALFGCRPFGAASPGERSLQVRQGLGDGPPRRAVPRWLWEALARGLRYEPSERFDSMDALIAALTRERRTRRLGWAAVAIAVVLSSAATATLAWTLDDDAAATMPDGVETLVQQARAAAAKSFFVYPPSEDPGFPTAYVRVRELEAMGTAQARGQAEELRAEFAATLVRLGDAYWERDGGRVFSADYYAAALVFEPDDQRARQRTLMTQAQLAGLAHKAARLDFELAELRAADILAALALPDDEARRVRVAALYDGDAGRPASSVMSELERVLGEPDRKPRNGRASAPQPASPSASVDLDPSSDATSPVEPDPAQPPVTARKSDPEAARRAARAGRAAFDAGKWADAERKYHAALEHQTNNLTALLGLSELYFEKGSYNRAVKFARRAVGVAPKRGASRIALGDALRKTVKYAEARAQYERAKALGDPRAKGRLERLDRQVGQ